jgi:hypothetical protein
VPGSGLLRIQCGFCLRTYTRVGLHNYLRPSTLQARPPLKITPSAPWRTPPELSPEVLAPFPPGTRIWETLPGQGGRLVSDEVPQGPYGQGHHHADQLRQVDAGGGGGHGRRAL